MEDAMPHSPRDQLANAGFNPADTKMLLKVFDSVSASYPSNPAAARIIAESLNTMASMVGTRQPAKLAAYAVRRARLVRSA